MTRRAEASARREPRPICPRCLAGDHVACHGTVYHLDTDSRSACGCDTDPCYGYGITPPR